MLNPIRGLGAWPAAAIALVLAMPPVPARATVDAAAVLRSYLHARAGVGMLAEVVVITPSANGAVLVTSRRLVMDRSGRSMVVELTRDGRTEAVTLKDGTWTWRYVPRLHIVKIKRCMAEHRSVMDLQRRYRLIRRNYDVALIGTSPLAGRKCYILRFTPRHAGSHTLQVWVDAATGAEMGRSESDWRGETLDVTMVTSASFPHEMPRSAFHYPIPKGTRRVNISRSPVLHDVGSLRRVTGARAVVPLVMPDGYRFESCAATSINGARTVVMRYTDGLATMTVCEQRPLAGCPRGKKPVYSWTRGEGIVEYVDRDMLFMVLGHAEPVRGLEVGPSLDDDRAQRIIHDLALRSSFSSATLRDLRDRGYGIRDLVALALARARRRASVAHVEHMLDAGYGWRDIARACRIEEPLILADVHALLTGAPMH